MLLLDERRPNNYLPLKRMDMIEHNTLALDLASTLGWAVHIGATEEIISGAKKVSPPTPKTGRKTLPDEAPNHRGLIFKNYHFFLRDMLKRHNIGSVVIERDLPIQNKGAKTGGFGGAITSRGLLAITLMHCCHLGIPVDDSVYAVSTKVSLTGCGKAEKSDMLYVANKAFGASTHDEADALALLVHHLG